MRLDFSQVQLEKYAFSKKAMTLLEPNHCNVFTKLVQIAAIETGPRIAREKWQYAQLANLLKFASERSDFWRRRIRQEKRGQYQDLDTLPVLTRTELRNQVEAERCLLLRQDNLPWREHATSGSSGIPVRFFISAANSKFNSLRSLAQYFIEGRNLSWNRTQLKRDLSITQNSVQVVKQRSWSGELEGFLKSGIARNISFLNPPIKRLRDALAENSVGYLIAYPWVVDLLLQDEGEDFLRKVDVKMWIPIGFAPDQNLIELFKSAEIPIRGTYSSEEVGLIGSMCPIHQDYYHIAGSNVLVEVEKERYFVRNKKLGRILITHLHSYGTPFIRYDIGDIGSLEERCPCGFDGPVLRDIVGRGKNLLMHPDGNLSYFHVEPRVERWLTKFSEYRFKQTAIDTVTVEVRGYESLAGEDEQRFIDLVRRASGFDFKVKVHAISKIDWGDRIKKHSFINEII